MKLLVATPLYPPETGGPATYSKLLEETLPQEGITVTLVKFKSVRWYPKIIRHIAYFFLLLLKTGKADAILALDPVSVGLPAALAARVLGKPFFVKIVGDYAWEQGTQRFGVKGTLDEFVEHRSLPFFVQMLKDIERWVALRAKKIIVPSAYLKKIVTAWRIPESRIVVIHNAVSIETIGSVPSSVSALSHPLIVSVGRLVPWKGMKELIDAVATIRETLPASLVIVGDGPERERVTTWAHKKLGAHAVVTGALSHTDTLAVMERGDVFALNTSYEGLSHLLIEALTLGKPIVTTNVGGNPELITHGENGMLVGRGDVTALTQALHAVMVDAPLRERLSISAQESAKRFSVDALVKNTAEFLKQNI